MNQKQLDILNNVIRKIKKSKNKRKERILNFDKTFEQDIFNNFKTTLFNKNKTIKNIQINNIKYDIIKIKYFNSFLYSVIYIISDLFKLL